MAASIRIFKGFAEEAKRIFSRTVPLDTVPGGERHFAVTIRQPLGVVFAVVPFNYPVELYAHKGAAALAAGNAVIAKPPSDCPLTLLKIAEIMEAAPAALDAIKKAGVPVVMVDRFLKGGPYTSWVGPDNYAIGVQDGQYITDRLGGKGVLVVLRGGPADNSIGLNRTNGMLSVVEKSSIEVHKAPNFGGWSSDGGFKLMEDMLARYPKIDAVFCENDSMCLGAQKAVADAGRSKAIFLVGVDGEKAALENIMKPGSNYAAAGLNNSDQIVRAAFNRMMAILAGAKAPEKTVLPSPIITKENVDKFYNPDSVF